MAPVKTLVEVIKKEVKTELIKTVVENSSNVLDPIREVVKDVGEDIFK